MTDQVATPSDATPEQQTPQDARSFDDRLLEKFGLGEPEAQTPEPEATPADDEVVIADEAEAEQEVEAPAEELELKHNGEIRKVPKDEAVRLAQMGYDYEFKMQRVNQDAQRLQGMAQALKAQHALQAQKLDALADVKSIEKQLSQFANVDLYAKSQEDPIGAFNLKLHIDSLKEAHAMARRKAEEFQQPLQQAEAHYDQERLALENEKLLQRIPEWKDTERRGKDAAAIRESMVKHYGFAEDEIGGPILADHRVLTILRDAQKYREALAAKKGPPQGLPKVAKPGAKPVPRSNSQQLGDIKRGLSQAKTKDARRALEDELIARKFRLK